MPTLIQAKSGIFYIVHYQRGKRVWRSTGTRNRAEARTALLRQEANPSTENKPVVPKLSECIQKYNEYVATNFSPKTRDIYGRATKRFLELVGDCAVDSITSFQIEQFKSDRAKGKSASTVNIDLRVIKAFYNCMKRWQIVSKNPTEGVRQIRLPQVIPAHLTEEQLKQLVQHIDDDWLKNIVVFAAMSGTRLGEIANLRWEEIDLETKTALIQSTPSFLG